MLLVTSGLTASREPKPTHPLPFFELLQRIPSYEYKYQLQVNVTRNISVTGTSSLAAPVGREDIGFGNAEEVHLTVGEDLGQVFVFVNDPTR